MKTPSILLNKFPTALRAVLLPAAVCATLATVSAQQTYTWTQGQGTTGPDALWGFTNNWVGSPALTFNNQTDIIFNDADVVNRGNAISIGGAKTIRSLTINADYETANNATFDIRTYNNFSSGAANLTFAAASGNASITVAQSTDGIVQVRLGPGSGGGNVVLNSDLDLEQNNTFFGLTGFQFDGPVSGAGAINKTGLGEVRLVRNNSGWSGGVNINEGNVTMFSDANAMGTGTWTLGGGANNTSFSVGSTQTFNNAGGIVVEAGAGTRTIQNYNVGVNSNPVLNSAIDLSAGKEVIFNTSIFTAGTADRLSANGAITGTGGIVKTGTGILILSGTGNTYSGTTDIQGGKLYLGGAGRLGTGDVTIASGANLDFGTGASQTNIVANNISGDGEIIQSLANTDTRITGDVTNTGGLTINNGTVRIGNGTTTGSYTGDTVINGGTLAFARTNAYTHGGTISGVGGVSKTNDGVVTVTGNNSYTGTTAFFAGVIVADHANALGNGGSITFSDLGGNTGTIRYTAASAGTDWATRIVNSPGFIRLDTNGNDVNLAGAIDSTNTGGLVKSGAGTLTLGGTNSYTGLTAANAGTLLINGSTAAGSTVSVGASGTLGGTGTIGGAVTVAGTLAPGNSPGTLNFSDDLTLESTATLSLEITGIGGGQFDILNGAGANMLTLDGTLALDNTGYSATLGDTITVFTNWDSISGTFASITGTDLGGGLSWDTSNLYSAGSLTVVPEPSTWALLAISLTALVVLRRRRRTC